MPRFDGALATFGHAMDRARQMVSLYDALSALRPNEPANDDALRSAYILAVSSFDFFVHELVAIEARHRFSEPKRTRNISLPMEIITITDAETRVAQAEAHVRRVNSYKAFVDPAKLADVLSCYCVDPWDKITTLINGSVPGSTARSADDIKGQLRSIWKRRNKIAHEADVNPTLAGVSLWPIDKTDAQITIAFMYQLGCCFPALMESVLEPQDAA
ncbi:hypothetical protein KZ813_16605 [Sphingomonas sp. RHCKR7]|uniref:HEPN domain-containing protein n=1 Tax=Sphingomonas folli TaxID=2862497 RepID=UPI001CA53272|nr:HEPN domain-containing protein [Sphingomonas folli]MBW6528466.1 hypothetical protein [Sphingomonas folli]